MRFKSLDHIFQKEKAGIKPNTVRKIDLNDDRFLYLISKAYNGFNEHELSIEIVNERTGEVFERWIEDITIWDGLIIISWEHNQLGKKNE